jgi:thiamine pyrophosphate-dependent acetolactate synthase large subunit-like protein
MTQKTGRHAIIEQCLADGMDTMFGNPGTVEQGFLDALRDYPQMKYILTLQETVALMMGDSYARATRKPTLVQIHSTPGLGNTIGAIYQAMRGHAPLVIIGGDAGLKYMPMEAQMFGDLVAFAKPVTKWSTMVTDSNSLLRTLRRAIKLAATPPMGPVYICLPADILDLPMVEEVVPTSLPSTSVVPTASFIQEATSILAGAQKPMIFMGDGVAYSEATEELTKVAELLGAEVWGVDSGELNVSYAHPLYMGQTGHMFGESSYPITSKGDVNLVVGTYMVPEVFPRLTDIYAPGAKVIHIDLNADQIAKNHRADLGVVSDPKATLGILLEALSGAMTPAQKEAAALRVRTFAEAKEKKLQAQIEKDHSLRDEVPMHPAPFMEALGAALPEDAIIFDEALTSSPDLTRYMTPKLPGHFFQTRGGSLGVGFPGAVGLKLLHPDKTVIGFSGDGGSMYTIQALWTAAHHKVAAKFIVCNNQNYMLLKLNVLQYWRDQLHLPPREFPDPFSLNDPVIDFAGLAQAMGVRALKVEKPEQIGPAIEQMLSHDGPFLIDLVISNQVP